MIFTRKQIEELLELIDLQSVYLVGYNLGEDGLTTADVQILRKHGISIDSVVNKYPPFLQSFLWGRLAALLSEYQAGQVTYANFMEYVRKKQWDPITRRERAEYEVAKQKTYHHIKSFGGRIKSSVNDIIIEEDQATRAEQERVLSGELQAGVLNRRSVNNIVSNIGRRLKDWNKDWGMIVDTEMQDIYSRGKAAHYVERFGEEQKVYKDTYAGACRWCIKLHTTSGLGSEPITFTLEELYANGSNVGLRKDQWRATVGPEHPYCYTSDTEVLTDQGWKYFYDVTPEQKYLSVDLTTNNAEWVKATNHIAYEYDGPIDVFKSRNFSLQTTPNHYHVVNTSTRGKNQFKLVKSNDLKKSHRFLRTIADYEGDNSEFIEIAGYNWAKKEFVQFLAYYLSDGNISLATASHQYQIKITQDREKSSAYHIISKCCKTLFTKVWEGEEAIYIPLTGYRNELVEYFLNFGKCNEKFIPVWLKNSDKKYIEIFLDAYVLCDGHIKKGKIWKGYQFNDSHYYSTTSNQLASDIGELILKIGGTPSYSKTEIKTTQFKNGTYTSNYPVWTVAKCSGKASLFSTVYQGQEHYKGIVYDVELEKHHTLFIRHDGKCCVSGNCRCDIRVVFEDQEWDEKKKRYVTVAEEPLEERKGKVKITVGKQNFEV